MAFARKYFFDTSTREVSGVDLAGRHLKYLFLVAPTRCKVNIELRRGLAGSGPVRLLQMS